MVDTRNNYTPIAIRAAHQMLVELAYLLRDHLNEIVFVGGMACSLLFPQDIDPHDGTIDIDLALDPMRLATDHEETLEDLLMAGLFQQDIPKKYRWVRTISLEDQPVVVKVDLLTCEYDGSRRITEHAREVDGVWPSVLRGVDLAFLEPKTVPINGLLRDGSSYQTQVQICNAASLLAMKGIAIVTTPLPKVSGFSRPSEGGGIGHDQAEASWETHTATRHVDSQRRCPRRDFAEQSLQNGMLCVLVSTDTELPESVRQLILASSRVASTL